MLGRSTALRLLAGFFLLIVLLFLYAPLVPPAIESFSGPNVLSGSLLSNYSAIFDDARLLKAVQVSIMVGLITAVVAPLLALIAAQSVRNWQRPRLIVGILLVPLFVPGVSMGVSTALFFKLLGLPPSIFTIAAVQIIWALPFAFLVILTVMATFDQVYLEAAHMCGAGPIRAFFEVELPQIHPGLTGASVFSLIISFNETIRTAIVQGGNNTVQTYIWSQYQQVGLSPKTYALMTLLIATTLLLLGILAFLDWWGAKNNRNGEV